MSKEVWSTLKVLPPFFDPRLEIAVRGDNRTTRYTEAVTLSENIFEQAKTIGWSLIKVSQQLSELLKSSDFRQKIGISEERFQNKIKPFLGNGEKIGFFGVDAIIDEKQNIKLIEINTRPQILGRFDEVTPKLIGQDDPNGKLVPECKTLIESSLSQGTSAVIVSHPKNTFHNYHLLFGEQMGIPVVPIQELTADRQSTVKLRGEKIGIMVRQFNIDILFEPGLTNQSVFEAISAGNTSLMNGPVVSVMGDKPLLPFISEIAPEIASYFPQMKIYNTGDEISLEDYWGWWLKGESGGNLEITCLLDKKELHSWRKDAIKAMMMGDFDLAKSILKGRENETAKRYQNNLTELEKHKPPSWLLQKNINPQKILVDNNGQVNSLYSMLRIYFVPNISPSLPPSVHLEMYLKDTPRVSAAGFIVPIKSCNVLSSI